jgi:hypothetical protein
VPTLLPTTVAALLLGGSLTAQDLRYRDGPSWLAAGASAFDAARGRLVALDSLGDTREWDGQRWLHRPSAGADFSVTAMAWHGATRRVLAFGIDHRLAAVTRSFDGAQWQTLSPLTMPSPRYDPATAYDAARARVVMFGGNDGFGLVNSNTWEWDGADWLLRSSSGPAPRFGAKMVFDAGRGVTVLYGGATWIGLADDVWEWDGNAWQQRTLAVRPTPRWAPAMAFDAARARTVLFGGITNGTSVLADLWEYDGASWTQVPQASPAPAGRFGHTLTALPGGEVMLFGGGDGRDVLRDLWSWNGVRWLARPALPAMPQERQGAAIALDPTGGGALLFSGGTELPARIFDDTWRWDGASWAQVATTGPPPRLLAAAWTDFADVFVFGGQANISAPPFVALGDTWRWNGSTWSAVTTALSPPPRDGAAVAYDAARGRAVLFGGRNGTALGDTWTFDGVNWQQRFPASSPPPRLMHALANDLLRARVVLFGGVDPAISQLDDTWEWNGTDWTQIATPARPPASAPASMAFDLRQGRIVLVLQSSPPATPAADVWSYDGTTWSSVTIAASYRVGYPHTAVGMQANGGVLVLDGSHVLALSPVPALARNYGSACGTAPPVLSGRTWPRIGSAAFGLDVAQAAANAPLALVAATAAANVPVGACTLLVAPGQAGLFALADAGGFRSLDLPVPAAPGLLGLTLFFQAAALQPASPAGFVLTAGLRVVVGD